MEIKKENNYNKINYTTFLFSNNNKLNNEEDGIINNEIYINIDSKNSFNETSETNLDLVNKRIESFKLDEDLDSKSTINNNEDDIQKGNLTKRIIKKFLEKLYPRCDNNVKKICYLISNKIKASKKLSKDKIEENVDYFFEKRYDLKYSTSLKFNKDFFTNCGYIFCYVYQKLNDVKINKIGGIKNYLQIVIEQNINALIDFYDYCTEHEKDPVEMKKTYVWENISKKYEIPAVMIFLLNLLQGINTLDFDIEFDGEILNENDINLFTITILNITYILPNLDHVNINFINTKLQYFLYEKYYKRVLNLIKIGEGTIKKNKIKNNYSIYSKKWDFEHNFNLEEYRRFFFKKENIGKKINRIYDKYSILYEIKLKNDINENEHKSSICNSMIRRNITTSELDLKFLEKEDNDDFEVISNEDEEEDEFFQRIRNTRSETLYINSNKENINKLKENKINSKDKKNQNIDIYQHNSFIFDIILMIICGVTRIDTIKKLNLLSNDFYNSDLIFYLKKYFDLDVLSIDNEFHILDLLYNKTKNLDELNIEINSLDILSFDKILGIIYKNQSLVSLKLSLFSSDVSYLIITLLKEYEQIRSYDQIKEYATNEGKNLSIEILEEKILIDISLCFIENMNLLFEIIKNKDNLEDLGLNFDLPSILHNNMNYKLPIIKFILNIILLIDNNEYRKKNNIKKLTLLSPHTILDNRLENNIDYIFKDIKIYKNSRQLKELNLQIQFHNIAYIKNLISPNLTILSIGDLDIISFINLVNYLTSYEFSIKSLLTNLNIKLLNNITYFNTKIKIILRKLFDIKIKTLLELKFFSNLIIDNKINYFYLIKILKYNWIPSYVITLNKKSEEISLSFNWIKKDVDFLISCSIEKKIYKEIDLNLNKKDKNDQKNDINDEVFWMLKYIFYCRYSNFKLNFLEIKSIIFGILKYLYLTSNIKLSHNIEESSNSI